MDRYYSLVAACAVSVQPRRSKLKLLEKRIGNLIAPQALAEITEEWIREMLDKEAFDPSLSLTARQQEFPFFEAIRAEDGLKRFFATLAAKASLDADVIIQLRRRCSKSLRDPRLEPTILDGYSQRMVWF